MEAGEKGVAPGEFLARLLAERGMSQGECARRLGVSRRRVISLIKGREFSAATARKLAEVFGIEADKWLEMQRRAEARGAGEADVDAST